MFESIRTAIIRQVSTFVEEVRRHTDGNSLPLKVRKSKGRPGLNDVFFDDGLASILDVAYVKKIDMVSPFTGGLIYRICGEPFFFCYNIAKTCSQKMSV